MSGQQPPPPPTQGYSTAPSRVCTAPSRIWATTSRVRTTPSRVWTTPSRVRTTPSRVWTSSRVPATTSSRRPTTEASRVDASPYSTGSKLPSWTGVPHSDRSDSGTPTDRAVGNVHWLGDCQSLRHQEHTGSADLLRS